MKYILLTISFILSCFYVSAQDFEKSADYIDFIKQNHSAIYQDVAVYVRNLERGEPIKSVDGLRRAIVKKLENTIVKVNGMPKYKGDNSLQDSLVSYTRRTHFLFVREYIRIQKLQDSVGKSFEATKRAIDAKAAALNSLIEDEKEFFESLKAFSSKYAVPVPPKYNQEYEKLTTIKEVTSQYNILLLMYAKCNGQESKLAKAINAKQKSDMEQHAFVLAKHVKEGYKVLDTLKPFQQDKSLIEASRNLLNFYQHECEFKVPALIAFLNAGVQDPNKTKSEVNPDVHYDNHDGVSTYANIKGDVDASRTTVLANWTKASQAFLKKNLQD